MSKTIFLVRHAQSSQNEAALDPKPVKNVKWSKCFLDAPLSDFGVQQAYENMQAAHELDVRKVFVSPLRRALKTADILFSTHPNSPSIIVHPLLTEKIKNAPDVSVYSGVPYEEFSHFDWSLMPNYYYLLDFLKGHSSSIDKTTSPLDILKYMKSLHPVKTESRESMYSRTQATKEIWRREDENVVLLAHSNWFKYFTRDQGTGWWLKNCEIRQYELF